MPRNIFGAAGDWETYSTPSSDLRVKLAFLGLYSLVEKSLSALGSNNRSEYDFSGSRNDLAGAYAREWSSKNGSSECTANARNSNGGAMSISLDSAMKTVFDWSFDPYQCPELRWGITGSSTCNSDGNKLEMYTKQAKLRWNTNKDANANTDYNFGNNSSKPTTDFSPLLSGGAVTSDETPTEPPAAVTFPKACRVQSPDGTANARQGPGTNYAVVKTLNNGASVRATEADDGWYSTAFRLGGVDFGEGNPAWIHSSLLQCN
jgi:hypothetical protein